MFQIMGILNVTPDSFSDGGLYIDKKRAINHAVKLALDGADIIDIGGESTRPGAEPVSISQELDRVIPIIEKLKTMLPIRISVDTRKPEVAKQAILSGASLINDVSAELFEVCAQCNAGWIAMHKKGEPKTMQLDPQYESVTEEVFSYLSHKAQEGLKAGVKEVYVDPGIGFGKTVKHNLELLAGINKLKELGLNVVVGTSRKSFLGVVGKIKDEPLSVQNRLAPTLATVAWLARAGVNMVRVHDVKETAQLRKLLELCQR
jgi:dihydropteroate synthase